MDISFELWERFSDASIAKNWEAVYPSFFDLFVQRFHNVQSLRVTIKLPAWEGVKDIMSPSKMSEMIEPLEKLAKSRDWKRLEFCIPLDWYGVLSDKAEGQGQLDIRITNWHDQNIWIDDPR